MGHFETGRNFIARTLVSISHLCATPKYVFSWTRSVPLTYFDFAVACRHSFNEADGIASEGLKRDDAAASIAGMGGARRPRRRLPERSRLRGRRRLRARDSKLNGGAAIGGS